MSPTTSRRPSRVVILVDNKRRDLLSCALIAHHLEQRGARVFLEPLEAYRAVLGAHQPDLILFNHLLASHLASYSAQLRERGVQVAVLPNEALLYNPEVLRFNCRRYNDRVHVDLYLCWSEQQRTALLANGYDPAVTRMAVVGNPKFDLHFAPWHRLFPVQAASSRPRLLFCTNFALARFHELPPAAADKFFDIWRKHVADYADYRTAIAVNHRSRARLVDFLGAVVAANQFEIVIRPHPSEAREFYHHWLAGLPATARQHMRLDEHALIYGPVRECDLEISCETCTTAIDSWLAGKPTIELTFDQHPMFAHAEVAGLNVTCADPARLVPTILEQLADPAQNPLQAARHRHLAKWCATPSGHSAELTAEAIIASLASHETLPSPLSLADRRRGWKLRALALFNLPYHFDPLLPVKAGFFPSRYASKRHTWEKSITPQLAAQARASIAAVARLASAFRQL